MKPFRWLPPFFAAATLLLLGANAIPASAKKHRLLRERSRLESEVRKERERAAALEAERRALEEDPFVLRRLVVETFERIPPGSEPWPPASPPEETPPPG